MLTVDSTGFSDALVILGAAGLVIPAFARLRVSPVIGFILVGVLAGPAGMGRFVRAAPWLAHLTIADPRAIEPFAAFGIVLLLFAAGLELSPSRLWSMRRTVFGLGAAELGLIAAALAAGLVGVGLGWHTALGLGLALALSSTALVLPIVGTGGPVGRNAFAMLLFEDLALVPILFVLAVLSPAGGDLRAIGRTLLLGAGVVAALLLAGRRLLPPLFAQAARTKSPELFLSASLLVVILASLATTAAGLSPVVGALIAGVLIAETDYAIDVEAITGPFRGLALGVFLITVGMRIELAAVAEHWPALLAAVTGVLAVKALVTGGLLRLGGTRRGAALETALLMAAPSETTLIVLGAATQARLLSPADAGFWQIVTAIGLTLTPLLARVGRLSSRRIERSDETDVPETSGAPHTLVIGFGRVGRLVAQMLDAHRRPYLAIDADVESVRSGKHRGYPVRFGDVGRPGTIERLGLDHAAALVLTMDDRVQVVRITRAVRALHPALPIIARARDPAHAAELYRAGATEAVPETLESSLQLSEAVLVELGTAMGPVIASIHEKRAQLRAKIMQLGDLDREPVWRRRVEE